MADYMKEDFGTTVLTVVNQGGVEPDLARTANRDDTTRSDESNDAFETIELWFKVNAFQSGRDECCRGNEHDDYSGMMSEEAREEGSTRCAGGLSNRL
jgi:hypothetical protein